MIRYINVRLQSASRTKRCFLRHVKALSLAVIVMLSSIGIIKAGGGFLPAIHQHGLLSSAQAASSAEAANSGHDVVNAAMAAQFSDDDCPICAAENCIKLTTNCNQQLCCQCVLNQVESKTKRHTVFFGETVASNLSHLRGGQQYVECPFCRGALELVDPIKQNDTEIVLIHGNRAPTNSELTQIQQVRAFSQLPMQQSHIINEQERVPLPARAAVAAMPAPAPAPVYTQEDLIRNTIAATYNYTTGDINERQAVLALTINDFSFADSQRHVRAYQDRNATRVRTAAALRIVHNDRSSPIAVSVGANGWDMAINRVPVTVPVVSASPQAGNPVASQIAGNPVASQIQTPVKPVKSRFKTLPSIMGDVAGGFVLGLLLSNEFSKKPSKNKGLKRAFYVPWLLASNGMLNKLDPNRSMTVGRVASWLGSAACALYLARSKS